MRSGRSCLFALLIVCTPLTGCAILLTPTTTQKLNHRCASHLSKESVPTLDTGGPHAQRHDAASARLYFSPQALYLAEIIDAVPILDDLSELHRANRVRTIEFLELRQQLNDRILLAFFEGTSMVAEIICERDHADQIADRMDEVDASTVKGLTLASIVIGGVAAIVSGGIALAGGASTAGNIAEVTGGALGAALGGTALFTKSEEEIKHDRNLLSEIWTDPPRSELFSPTVWRFLHSRRGDIEIPSAPRDELITAWRQQGRLGKPGSKEERQRIALFFGNGGRYDAGDLRGRASMLETLEATVRMMNQELELFVREIGAKFGTGRAAR